MGVLPKRRHREHPLPGRDGPTGFIDYERLAIGCEGFAELNHRSQRESAHHGTLALRRIVRAIDLRSRQLVDQLGLTGPQLMVLREARRIGSAPISVLARKVSLSQPTVSGIVDRLEKSGLVRRERIATDRRTVAVTITPAGGRVLRDAPSLLQDHFNSQLERLEQFEQTQILATLQRIAWMMDAEHIDAPPLLETGTLTAPGVRQPESGTPELPRKTHQPEVNSS